VRDGAEDDTLVSPGSAAPGSAAPGSAAPATDPVTDPRAVTRLLASAAAARAAEPDRPEGPAWIGRFVVFEELGAGGMGQVFAAYDPELDRKVALKLVQRPPDGVGAGDWQARLIREAQAMAKLSHPNVVTVYEVGAHAGQVFLAMELVQGRDLARWLATPRSWRDIIEVFRAAGEGLAAAHGAGLVHRDFKPANVLVGDDGRVRVADFGLVMTRTARELALRDSGSSHGSDVFARELTNFGAVMGTPAYMAPEQISGETADERSDVFSFCVALWEALYGLRPFGGDTMTGRLAAIRRGEIREPGPSATPRWLRPLLLRGLADEPGDRWPNMRALLAALARDPERERARRRRSALLVVGVLVLGGALVYGGSALWSVYRAHAREAVAQQHLDATLARLAALRAEGRKVEADAIVDAFVADPEHAGTRAQVRALRWRAEQRRASGDLDGAQDAYSAAYAAAHDAGEAGEVLLDLATLFHARRAWGPLTWVLASLEGQGLGRHARAAPLRVDAALIRRDFAAVAGLDPRLAGLGAALGQARPSERRAARVAVIDRPDDGAPVLALFDFVGPAPGLTLVRATEGLPVVAPPGISPGLSFDREVPVGDAGGALAIGSRDEDERLLLGWRGDRWETLARWSGSVALDTARGDLDGDGVDEIYVGSGPYDRRLVGLRRTGAGWREFSPSPQVDAAKSDVRALAIGDVDGDGREELLVGLGAWQAYDLRVLRPDPDGGPFAQVARRKLGPIDDVVILPTPEGPLIAVAKSPETLYAAPAMFPDGDHIGVPAGLYLFRLRAGALEEVAFSAIEPSRRLRTLAVADLDGDGRAELVGDLTPIGGAANDLLIVRAGAGELAQLRVGQLQLLAALDLDGDPADELLVADLQDGHRVWTLGVGDQRLPALDLGRPRLAVAPPAALADDASLRRQWVHAGELAGLGLLGAAGRQYVELARALPQGPARVAALVQAAELAASAGELADAAARFEEAGREGPGALLERAADHYERSGRFDDAIRVLGEVPRPGSSVQARLGRHVEWLASEREYAFDRPLDAAWLLHDPVALRHDRIRGVLRADLMAPEPALGLPVTVGPDFVVRVGLSLTEINFGGSFALRLRPDDPAAAPVEVRAYRSGSSGTAGVKLVIGVGSGDPAFTVPLPAPDDRVTLELSQLAASGELRLSLALNDVPVGANVRPAPALVLGPAQLELLRSDPLGGAASEAPWARVELLRLVTRGLTVRAPAPDPWAAARRALVEGEGALALAALAAAGDGPDAPESLPLWRALALLDGDDAPGASQVLRDALDLRAPDSPQLRGALRLLRARGEAFAPVLRAAVGPGYLQLFDDAWGESLRTGYLGVPMMRAFLEHAPALAGAREADVPGLRRPLDEVRSAVRLARAAIYAELRHSARAHDELAQVDARRLAELPETRRLLGTLLYRLAALDLADNRIDHVFEHLAAARSFHAPEMFADILRADRGLTALHGDPRWRALLGE